MNYQSTYDPMQASAMRQNQNSLLAQNIKSGLGAVQTGLQENAQWKKYVAKYKTATDAKANLWATAKPIIQESGIDPSKITSLANIESDIANENITALQFGANLEKALTPFKETIMGKKAIAEQLPEARQPMDQIKGIPGTDAMIPESQPQSSFVGPPVPAGTPSNFVGPQLPPATSDPMVGATEPLPTYTEPDLTPEQLQHKNVLAQQQAMIKMFKAKSDAGSLDTGDAAKFTTDMMALSMKDKDIEIAKLNLERTNAQKDKTQSADDIIGFAKNNFPLYDVRTGKKIDWVDIADVRANPQNYSTVPTGKVFAPERNNFGGVGAGSNPDELKLRASVREDLEVTRKDDFTNEPILDEMGEPTGRVQKVMIPGSMAEQILMGPQEMFDNYVTTRMPRYSHAVGIDKPKIPTFTGPNDPKFLKLPSESQFFDNKGVLRTKK